jgi:hypothetical protein
MSQKRLTGRVVAMIRLIGLRVGPWIQARCRPVNTIIGASETSTYAGIRVLAMNRHVETYHFGARTPILY